MRRGTPAAIEFGAWLFAIRTSKKMTMRQVGEKIGCPAATISQVEKGQRALKEPKIHLWATALDLDEDKFRKVWEKYDAVPNPPVVRRRGKSIEAKKLEGLFDNLSGPERERVRGYIDAIIENR